MVVVMVVMVVVVVAGGEIVVVKVENEITWWRWRWWRKIDWLMNDHARFGTYHRLDFNHRSWEISFQLLGPYNLKLIWWRWCLFNNAYLYRKALMFVVVSGHRQSAAEALIPIDAERGSERCRLDLVQPWKDLQVGKYSNPPTRHSDPRAKDNNSNPRAIGERN